MKRVIIALAVLAIAIQFIPAKRTNPGVAYDFDGAADVKAILKRSCYDCHSNETQWPWYSHVAPVSWLVSHDVKEGREHLNFSNWEPLKDVPWIRTHICEIISKGEMPPKPYILMHSETKVSADDLALLKQWAGE